MTDDFAADGQLAKAITGFKPREPHSDKWRLPQYADENAQPLQLVAGTGTGKTHKRLAAPALPKAIISTGSALR